MLRTRLNPTVVVLKQNHKVIVRTGTIGLNPTVVVLKQFEKRKIGRMLAKSQSNRSGFETADIDKVGGSGDCVSIQP